MIDRVATVVFRWRHVLLTIELVLAGAFAVVGFQALHRAVASPPPVVHVRGLGAPSDPGPAARLLLPPRAVVPTPRSVGTITWNVLSPDLLTRINHDDLALYREQWQAIQVILAGVRGYLEQRVLPRVLHPGQ